MGKNWLIVLILAISNLGLMVGCHHNKPAVAPTSPPSVVLEEEDSQPALAKAPLPNVSPKMSKVHEAKIPLACVSEIDQDLSDCHSTANPTVARCNNILIKFGCLSYRNQVKSKANP